MRSMAQRAEGRSPEYKIVRNDFEHAKHGPKGKIQEVFCDLSTPTIFYYSGLL